MHLVVNLLNTNKTEDEVLSFPWTNVGLICFTPKLSNLIFWQKLKPHTPYKRIFLMMTSVSQMSMSRNDRVSFFFFEKKNYILPELIWFGSTADRPIIRLRILFGSLSLGKDNFIDKIKMIRYFVC